MSIGKLGELTVVRILRNHTEDTDDGSTKYDLLAVVRDAESGEEGHLIYRTEIDGQDIVDEETFTDNYELFANHHPEVCDLQDLLEMDDDAPTELTPALSLIISQCTKIGRAHV